MFRVYVSSLVWLFLFFALFPLGPSFNYTFYDQQRLSQSVLLLLLALFMATRLKVFSQTNFYIPRKIQISILVFACLGLLSSFVSSEPLNALMYWMHFVLLFVAATSIAFVFQNEGSKPLLAAIVIMHSSLVAYCMLNVVFAFMRAETLNPSLVYFGFDNIRFFNQVQIFVLPLLLYFTDSRSFGRLAAIFLTLNLFLMFVGGGLGILLAWVCVLSLLLSYRSTRIAGVRGVVLTLVGFVVFVGLNSYLVSATGAELRIMDGSDGGRIELWSNSLSQFELHHLAFGIGPSIFSAAADSIVYSHPHNVLIELFVEWGLPATLCATVFVFWCIVTFFVKNQHKRISADYPFVFASWFGGGLLSFVSGVLVMPVPQTLFFIMLGLFIARSSSHELVEHSPSLRNKGRLVSVLGEQSRLIGIMLAGFSLIYISMVLSSFIQIQFDEAAFQGPRFWLSGIRYF